MKRYSADSRRLWVAMCGGIVKDKPFSYQDMDFAKSFTNKLFNTANFVKLAIGKGKAPKSEPHKHLNVFDFWILNRLNAVVKSVTAAYDSFALYEAMSTAVNFYWHEFADYYIEDVKHRVYSEGEKGEKSKDAAIFTLRHVCTTMLKLFAPVIPHISEEINFMFSDDSIFVQEWPRHLEEVPKASYVINGFVQKTGMEIDPESVGAMLNGIIGDVRKQKANARVALNKEIASININVPEEYYNAIEYSKGELISICKAAGASVSKGKYSVEIKL
jgi:valyl-tRNA synthetase